MNLICVNKKFIINKGGAEEQRDWFDNEDDLWIYERYNYSEEFTSTTDNLLAVHRGERILLSSRMFIGQHPIADSLFAFRSNVFTSSLEMIMKPGFPLLYKFNRLILRMRDHGFLAKINHDFRFLHTYLKRLVQNPSFFFGNYSSLSLSLILCVIVIFLLLLFSLEHVVILTIGHLQGPFQLLALGMTTACLTLLGELLVYRFWHRS